MILSKKKIKTEKITPKTKQSEAKQWKRVNLQMSKNKKIQKYKQDTSEKTWWMILYIYGTGMKVNLLFIYGYHV